MVEISELLTDADISGQVSAVGANPVEPTSLGDVHYQATLHRGDRSIDVYCSTGSGRAAPTLADALSAAGRRAAAVERAASRADWARARDLDPDAPEAARWYDAQHAEAGALRDFLGDEAFAALTRAAADQNGHTSPEHRTAPDEQDPVGYPARSDEMTFQEPALAAEEESGLDRRTLATAAGAVGASIAIGAAAGGAAGRAVRRLPAAPSAAVGGLIGLAAGALAAVGVIRRRSARDAFEELSDQRSAIETGRD